MLGLVIGKGHRGKRSTWKGSILNAKDSGKNFEVSLFLKKCGAMLIALMPVRVDVLVTKILILIF